MEDIKSLPTQAGLDEILDKLPRGIPVQSDEEELQHQIQEMKAAKTKREI